MDWSESRPDELQPENPPPDDGDADGVVSTHEDLLILSAIVRGVDITEIYSPPRVTEMCRMYWLETGESRDLKSGGTSATEENNDEYAHWSDRERRIW